MHRVTILSFMALWLATSLVAQQDESPVPIIPTEESPFHVLRDDKNREKEEGRVRLSQGFPRNKDADTSGGKMVTEFFTGMFASVKLGGSKEGSTGSAMSIEPKKFSLDDRREVTITYVITNKTRDILKLDFTNAQRIEITITDPAGKVVERWSDDRFFSEVTGVVMINPGERIEYIERIPTREMVPGQKYIIEASIPNYPEFTRTVEVTPSGTPRPPAPAAATTPPTAPSAPIDDDRNYL